MFCYGLLTLCMDFQLEFSFKQVCLLFLLKSIWSILIVSWSLFSISSFTPFKIVHPFILYSVTKFHMPHVLGDFVAVSCLESSPSLSCSCYFASLTSCLYDAHVESIRKFSYLFLYLVAYVRWIFDIWEKLLGAAHSLELDFLLTFQFLICVCHCDSLCILS